jgi:predicted transcriptional regulator
MSTLKLMQIMVEKGLLSKDDTSSKHLYTAALEESKTKTVLLNTVIERVFKGSASDLVMQLLGGKKLTAEERKTLEALVKKFDQK